MTQPDGFEMLFTASFDLATDRLERSEAAIVDDRLVHLLRRENRIALAKGKTQRVTPADAEEGLAYYDVPLLCVVHSHPECRFRWSRLAVDLTPTARALICDMVPRTVEGEGPVELETTIGVGLKFELVAKALKAEAEPSYKTKRTVYYPRIVSGGTGFTKGYWDFLALTTDYLHADRELRLLISAPQGEPLAVRFRLSAKVAMAGLLGQIPLLTRQGEIDEVQRLD
jgi:hypothetical protein